MASTVYSSADEATAWQMLDAMVRLDLRMTPVTDAAWMAARHLCSYGLAHCIFDCMSPADFGLRHFHIEATPRGRMVHAEASR